MIYNGEECYGVVYTITHNASGKKYVGQSTKLGKRWAGYRNLECKGQPKLLNALCKYGTNAFTFSVVFVAYDKGQLDWLECWFISELDAVNTGYNCMSGGARGKPGLETRMKMRAAKLGKKNSPEACRKISLARTGKKRSPGLSAKLLAAHLGSHHSPETRAKMRATHLGKILSPEHREKLRLSHLGKTPTPESLVKKSASLKESWRRRKLAAQQLLKENL
jgi:group I intron endonuclease